MQSVEQVDSELERLIVTISKCVLAAYLVCKTPHNIWQKKVLKTTLNKTNVCFYLCYVMQPS